MKSIVKHGFIGPYQASARSARQDVLVAYHADQFPAARLLMSWIALYKKTTQMNTIRSFSLLLVALICTTAPAITIDTVPVGDVGTPNDPATGNVYGGVNFADNIGKYEVTVSKYAAFLNAVAETAALFKASEPDASTVTRPLEKQSGPPNPLP